jgi:hypothetical protein
MTAEGWDGKSIRQHVEHIETEAARAVEIAQALEERIDSLRLEHLNTLDLAALAPPAPKGAKK